jgi:phosphate transport system substrate-binding protein
MKHIALAILISCTFLLAACNRSTSTENAGASFSTQDYIENKGSDTLVNLALAWAEEYQNLHPEIQISVTGGGSGTGFAALINGTIDLANASRAIKPEEIETSRSKGFDPVEIIVANDAIAVIVHPDNPVSELTLEQVSKIYRGEFNNWQDVGGEDRPIVRLSRETNSGTHVYFLEEVIRLGSSEDKTIFSSDTLLLPSSEGIISEVSSNPNAIGYDGLGYVTEHVKMVGIAARQGGEFVLPSAETVMNDRYAISRHLFMYTRGEPQGTLAEYINWILGPDAQQIVTNLGFVPVIPQ